MMKTRALITALCCLLAVAAWAMPPRPVKVACVGNSITYGSGIENRDTDSYPAQLQRMLGPGYRVGNFGKPGATLLRKGHNPYNKNQEYADALAFVPDIAVIHLGINDTDPRNWPNYADEFIPDYLQLIADLREVNPQMRIIIARLTPITVAHRRFKSGTRDWRDLIQGAIAQVALAAGVELIDMEEPLLDRQNLLPDALHPTPEGAKLLAQTAYSAITGDYGGLQLPPVYTSGMVLQRHQPVRIRGRADAGMPVTATLGGNTATAIADNRGHFELSLPPMTEGTGYTLTVTDGDTSLRFTDVAIGEVWLASGQSNMAFVLSASDGAKADIEASADSLLRFFNMQPSYFTYPGKMPDSVLDSIDRLQYFVPTQWQHSSPESTPTMSAIAYYFARELRDSLQVPVGIIHNAVGGAPTEAWIDIATLQHGLPEAMIDWTANDYVQPWAQGRALDNMGGDKHRRHPYEPTYLFASGMRPLGAYPIAGVLWYQGESNAHNVEVHEALFPLLVQSFREYWEAPELPVVYAQLSSLSRPSWPLFRDSQRRLMQRVPYTGMVVTSDVGDSLDVHPTRKLPVGHRMAAWALRNAYSYNNVTPSGPLPSKAWLAAPGQAIVAMDYGEGMRAADGGDISTFEACGADGVYRKASASVISDNLIMVTCTAIDTITMVRYGWQPFTRANLENGAGLPASTFRIEVTNGEADDSGIDSGVSGACVGAIGDRLVRAGGCNFPENPLGADSRKKLYQGIYVYDASTDVWERVGQLPVALAYAASAVTPQGMVIAGGVTPEGATAAAWLVAIDADGKAHVSQLPSLPCAVDNAAACAAGLRVYVAGGNEQGAPSRNLLCLDLGNVEHGWTALAPMPGNARVQPVMAAAPDARGKECLWLWGGFAPAYGDAEATLDTAGLCYSIARNKWSSLPAPTDEHGAAVSLGGGCAVTLPDGQIVAAGGVNKDVFLEALRNQAPDYLTHPAEWYRFNRCLLVFDPKQGRWRVGSVDERFARAGAGMALLPSGIAITGGELKPRIRTTSTLTGLMPQ